MEKQSLTVRFNILLVGSVLLCGLLLGAFFLVTLRATLIEGLNRSGREIASALGAVIASDILLDDRFTISDQLERTLEKNPEVRYILVTYPDGRILASTFPDGLPEGLLPLREKTDTEPHIYRSTEGPIREILYPIDDGITGYLRIGLTEREARLDRHLGLVSMKERAELLDGSFTVESAPGAGTRLFLHLPRKKESGGPTS